MRDYPSLDNHTWGNTGRIIVLLVWSSWSPSNQDHEKNVFMSFRSWWCAMVTLLSCGLRERASATWFYVPWVRTIWRSICEIALDFQTYFQCHASNFRSFFIFHLFFLMKTCSTQNIFYFWDGKLLIRLICSSTKSWNPSWECFDIIVACVEVVGSSGNLENISQSMKG